MHITAVCPEARSRGLTALTDRGAPPSPKASSRGAGLRADGGGSLTSDVPEETGAGPFPLALLTPEAGGVDRRLAEVPGAYLWKSPAAVLALSWPLRCRYNGPGRPGWPRCAPESRRPTAKRRVARPR